MKKYFMLSACLIGLSLVAMEEGNVRGEKRLRDEQSEEYVREYVSIKKSVKKGATLLGYYNRAIQDITNKIINNSTAKLKTDLQLLRIQRKNVAALLEEWEQDLSFYTAEEREKLDKAFRLLDVPEDIHFIEPETKPKRRHC